MHMKDRKNEIMAEGSPFPMAVKYPDANIFTPDRRKVNANSFSAGTPISNMRGSSEKKLIKGDEKTMPFQRLRFPSSWSYSRLTP